MALENETTSHNSHLSSTDLRLMRDRIVGTTAQYKKQYFVHLPQLASILQQHTKYSNDILCDCVTIIGSLAIVPFAHVDSMLHVASKNEPSTAKQPVPNSSNDVADQSDIGDTGLILESASLNKQLLTLLLPLLSDSTASSKLITVALRSIMVLLRSDLQAGATILAINGAIEVVVSFLKSQHNELQQLSCSIICTICAVNPYLAPGTLSSSDIVAISNRHVLSKIPPFNNSKCTKLQKQSTFDMQLLLDDDGDISGVELRMTKETNDTKSERNANAEHSKMDVSSDSNKSNSNNKSANNGNNDVYHGNGGMDTQFNLSLSVFMSKVAQSLLAIIQKKLFSTGALSSLCDILGSANWHSKVFKLALRAAAGMCSENNDITMHFLHSQQFSNTTKSPNKFKCTCDSALNFLLSVLYSPSAEARIAALECICNVSKLVPKLVERRLLKLRVLPAVIQLLYSEKEIQLLSRVYILFAQFLEENGKWMEGAVSDSVAEEVLSSIMNASSITNSRAAAAASKTTAMTRSLLPQTSSHFKQACLLVFSQICSKEEAARTKVIEAGILPELIDCMNKKQDEKLIIASCFCLISLSRSVKQLQTALAQQDIVISLKELISSESELVRIVASAALCNFGLPFSPHQHLLLEKSFLKRIISLLDSTSKATRINAMSCLRNLSFASTSQTKLTILNFLPFSHLFILLKQNEDKLIKYNALAVIQNISCDQPDLLLPHRAALIKILIRYLDKGKNNSKEEAVTSSNDVMLVERALYVLCNFASGNKSQKKYLTDSIILLKIKFYLSHKVAAIRAAAVWCVYNLLSCNTGAFDLAKKLNTLSFHTSIKHLQKDRDIVVKQRAKKCVELFKTNTFDF